MVERGPEKAGVGGSIPSLARLRGVAAQDRAFFIRKRVLLSVPSHYKPRGGFQVP